MSKIAMFRPIFWKIEHGDPLLFHFLTACAINNRLWPKKIGTFVWPKTVPSHLKHACVSQWDESARRVANTRCDNHKHNVKKITKTERDPFHQPITAIMTERKREAADLLRLPTCTCVCHHLIVSGPESEEILRITAGLQVSKKKTNDTLDHW